MMINGSAVATERPPGLSTAGVSWVAAHGGAGASTLAAALGGVDVGARWPSESRADPARVLLVARTHSGGLRATARALAAMREGRHPPGMELLGLVLVADAPGRLPWPLFRRTRVLRSVAPVWRVPWIEQWRLGAELRKAPKVLLSLADLVDDLHRGAY
ncbi:MULTISPECIES: DUF6668 family protein [Catenuloplanes]|uniref:Uncharacterized protein n=1 Tax=Catenuloplanes niger TaxID=587534 RepID=A0AAE3ZLY8_9ACTN|nr:DUF6668 family protein [Catenuloplanes niger]MDR7320310.1 hypothetical protein [Catenuloplanes niger]